MQQLSTNFNKVGDKTISICRFPSDYFLGDKTISIQMPDGGDIKFGGETDVVKKLGNEGFGGISL